jgi:hypothetical protein
VVWAGGDGIESHGQELSRCSISRHLLCTQSFGAKLSCAENMHVDTSPHLPDRGLVVQVGSRLESLFELEVVVCKFPTLEHLLLIVQTDKRHYLPLVSNFI